MATKKQGQVTLRGRFRPGSRVRLVKVRDESVFRAEGGKEVGTATVDDSGCVQFTSGVEVGARYFIVGRIDGTPVEVRVRGNEAGEESSVLTQAPVGYDRVKLGDGSWADEPLEQTKPNGEVQPNLGQHQVGDDVVQRSSTLRGQATPVDPEELAPYPSQQDEQYTTGKVLQRSDTEFGQATPIPETVTDRQEDSPAGLVQRSDTPHGVTTPIPAGDSVEIQRVKEAAETKAAVGEPTKAAARPVEAAKTRKPAARKRSTPKRKAAAKKPAAKKTSAAKTATSKTAAPSSRKSPKSTSKRSK